MGNFINPVMLIFYLNMQIMNVKKEVYDRCLAMIDDELKDAKRKLWRNKYEINKLAEQQRILKAEVGKLYELRKTMKP